MQKHELQNKTFFFFLHKTDNTKQSIAAFDSNNSKKQGRNIERSFITKKYILQKKKNETDLIAFVSAQSERKTV